MKSNEFNGHDEFRQIDDLFRSGLQDYHPEPSTDLWKGISRKLWWDELSHFMFTNLSSVLWIGGFASLAIIIGVIVITSIPQSAVTNGIFVQNLSGPNSPFGYTTAANLSGKQPTNAFFVKEEKVASANTTSNQIVTSHPSKKRAPSKAQNSTSLQPTTSAPTLFETFNTPSSQITFTSSPNSDILTRLNAQQFDLLALNDTQRIITPNAIYNIPKTKPALGSFFSIYGGAAPEYLTYPYSDPDHETTVFGNIGVAYHKGWFSLRTGIGLGYVYSNGSYNIDYKSKDSVGYYNSVIGYAVNQSNPHDIIYITQTIVVYDSVEHVVQDRTNNRYPYLTIPLLMGFRVYETNRFGLSVEAGPSASFFLGAKEPEPIVTIENGRILNIENTTPIRTKTTWQLFAGLRFDYQLSKQFSIYAQPYYKYYFKQVTSRVENTSSSPYSIGLGFGIEYYFGQRTH